MIAHIYLQKWTNEKSIFVIYGNINTWVVIGNEIIFHLLIILVDTNEFFSENILQIIYFLANQME